jgi:hypothetical protein
MKIEYKLSEEEYLESVNLHHVMGYRKLMIFIYIAFAATVVVITTDYSEGREIFRNFGALFFAVAFYLLLTKMLGNYQSKKLYERSDTLSKESILRVTAKGIRVGENEKAIPWKTFTKYKENEKYFLLYTSLNNFKIIPKRVMTKINLEEFSTTLEKHIIKT